MANLPAPTSTADPLNASNAKRLLDIFRNFILATSSQESSFGVSEAVSAICMLAKQLKLPSIVAFDKKSAKKDLVPPNNTALDFLLGTLRGVLEVKESESLGKNPVADLNGPALNDVLDFCFNCLSGSNAPSARKDAADCLGFLSVYHLGAVVDLFKERLSKCKSDDDYRAYSSYQSAVRSVRFSFDSDKIGILLNYLNFLVVTEAKFTATSLRNAMSESLIEALQEFRATELLPNVADDTMRTGLGTSFFKLYEIAMKKWIKKPKSRAAGFKLAMYMFLLFDPQRKDLNKRDITKIFLDQLKDSKQRLEGIESFSSFLRMLPPDFAKPHNPGSKVWKMIITDAIPALFVKKTKDVSAVEWKELTGVLSKMLQLDETLLTEPTLISVLKSADYSIDSRCVVLRAFGGLVVSSPDAQLGQSLQPSVTPIISQFCSSSDTNVSYLSTLLVCFPSLCIPESRRKIATSLVPGALSSDPEIWTCSLQALQRFLLDDPESHLPFLLQEIFAFLKDKAASQDALVHVRGVSLLLSSYANSRHKSKHSTPPSTLGQSKAFCLCWLLHGDAAVRDEAASMLDTIGQILENDMLDILVNATGLRLAMKSKSKAAWTSDLCSGLLADQDFHPLIKEVWSLLPWSAGYSTFFAKTLHVVLAGDQSQVGVDVVTHMISAISNEEVSPPVRSGICDAFELVDASVVESVLRLALTVVNEASKKKGIKAAPTLRGKSSRNVVPQSAALEILMLRAYAVLIRKVSPEMFDKSSFVQSFLSDRMLFWTSGQLNVNTLDGETHKIHLARLVASSFVLHQCNTDRSPEPLETRLKLIGELLSGDAVAPRGLILAAADAIKQFFRFASIMAPHIVTEWVPFALHCARQWSQDAEAQSMLADGLCALLERYPGNLHEFILDALKESNVLLFTSLCRSFERHSAYWISKAGPEVLLAICLLKMCSGISVVRELAFGLANVLARENYSAGKELFYTKNLDFNMYLQQAIEHSAAVGKRRPQLARGLFVAFASIYAGLADQQKTLSLILLEPWTQYFGLICAESEDAGRAILSSMLRMSVDSDPVFHRENMQRLYASFVLQDNQLNVVVDFLLSRYSEQSDHCILCLASLMRTQASGEIVIALESKLRAYPVLSAKAEIPTTAKSLDNFAEFDSRASAAFQMLQYVSLEHSVLLYRFLPSLLQSAFVYYRSGTLIGNLIQSLLRMDDLVPECRDAVKELESKLQRIMEHFGDRKSVV